MTCQKLVEASFPLAVLAWIGTIMSSELPKWSVKKMSEHIVIWEGLWNLCEDDGLQSLRCILYSSRPVLPQDLQVSGVLVVICIIITSMGLLLYMIGDKLITCVSNINNEENMKMVASGLFLGVGLLLLVSVSWVTHNVILGMANPQMLSQWKPEIGASLYLGCLSSLLLQLGGVLLRGALLWCDSPTNNDQPSAFEGSRGLFFSVLFMFFFFMHRHHFTRQSHLTYDCTLVQPQGEFVSMDCSSVT